MNCALNYQILKSAVFDHHSFIGTPGDNGTALGSGFLAAVDAGLGPARSQELLYLGGEYSEREIEKAVRDKGLSAFYVPDVEEFAANRLERGELVGWFQGRSEFGARALGNRSILADPRRQEVRERLNVLVKKRERFRPFAPSILHARQAEFLDLDCYSPYMCLNARVRSNDIPAVTHVDGTARFQSVGMMSNPRFRALLERFDETAGVPVLLNTSFNDREPIVESPTQALDCFERSGLDCLILGNYAVVGQ